MTKELTHAYPLLKRQWEAVGGHIERLRPPGVKGVPDFLLTDHLCGNVVCEVKCVEKPNDPIKLDYLQAHFIETVYRHGGAGCVLAYNLEGKLWTGFYPDGLYACVQLNLVWREGIAYSESVTPSFICRMAKVGLAKVVR